MPRVQFFEIHCDDCERAGAFFRDVFGWTFDRWDGPVEYWTATTGEASESGINGGLMRRRDPAGAVYNTINVPDLDQYMEKVVSHGGTIVVEKMAIPGVGWLAYCKDKEGNVHGMMELDTPAGQ